MNVQLDIKDSNAAFVAELIENFTFVEAEPLTPYKAEILQSIKQAVVEMNLIKEGEIKEKPVG